MCLILFRFQPDSPQSLVVAANRDEFYARPALAAHYWQDRPGIFAGRDLTAGGSWLGVTRSGRFAALTNFSAGDPVQTYPASRGELVADFLASQVAADAYIQSLEPTRYAGFNLLVYDGKELHYTTNKGFPSEKLLQVPTDCLMRNSLLTGRRLLTGPRRLRRLWTQCPRAQQPFRACCKC